MILLAYSQLFTLEKRVKAIEDKVALYKYQLRPDSPMAEEKKAQIRAAIHEILSESEDTYPLFRN